MSDNKNKTKKNIKRTKWINWFDKNDKTLISITSLIMMSIAVLSFIFSVIQNKKNSDFQREFTEKQRISDSIRDINTQHQFIEQLEYQKYRDSLNFVFYKEQANMQFKNDSQTIKIALDEYTEASRPFVSLIKTDLITNNINNINFKISFGNKCNVPIQATDLKIQFSRKNHPPLNSSLSAVLAPNESAVKEIGIQFFKPDNLELITIRILYHSIFNQSKQYYTERKIIYIDDSFRSEFIEQTTGLIK